MTTFTMQDLTPTQLITDHLNAPEVPRETKEALREILNTRSINNLPTTPEEDEAMDTLAKQQESNAVLETIQGATGAQYTPIDFKQFEGQTNESKTIITAPPTVQELAQQLTQTFNQLITAIANLQTQAQPVSEGLEETVDTVLQNADWFANKVDEKLDELIDDHDFDYEIERAVENHFGDFCLEDHVDVSSEIESIVDDRLDDMVQEKVEEILREKLSTATISFN
jgi:glycerate kinase